MIFDTQYNYTTNVSTMKMVNKRKRLADEEVAPDVDEKKKRLKSSQDLIGAARKGDIQLCIAAIRDGADVQFQSCGLSPLFYAAFYGHSMIIDYLLNCGANVNEKNPSGITPLAKAVEVGLLVAVKCLISHSADPNIADAKGITPLMKAVRLGRLDLVSILVEEGNAMVDYKNEELNTALNEAAFKGNAEIAKYLLEKGAQVDLKNAQGKTALHRAVTASKAAMVTLLVDNNADVNAQDAYGFTALHLGAFHGTLDCVKLLVEKGADATKAEKNGKIPLDIAQGKRHFTIVDYLREVTAAQLQ